MQKYCIISVLIVWMLVPSMQVIMTPCQVRNIETQPKLATSLPRRALVQVVQIPPVFTQKVMVGRCVNATSEISGAPGSYFVCKQRYSSVELYITENTSLAGITQFYNNPNATVQGILDKFKQSKFVREFVVVESGCDFTFNLLPLLLQRNHQQANNAYQNPTEHQSPSHDVEEPHRFHFLKSPYHSTQQHQQATPPSLASNPQINYQSTNSQDLQQSSHSPASYTAPSSPSPVYSYSPYPQGGNVNYGESDRRGGNTVNNHPASTGTTHNYVTSDPSTPSFYQPRGTYGESSSTIQGRGKIGHHSSDHTHHKSEQISTPTQTAESESEPELYSFSDKVGVPLYILSPEVDPLLKNIESKDSYYSTN